MPPTTYLAARQRLLTLVIAKRRSARRHEHGKAPMTAGGAQPGLGSSTLEPVQENLLESRYYGCVTAAALPLTLANLVLHHTLGRRTSRHVK
jgi:hypothetical protein